MIYRPDRECPECQLASRTGDRRDGGPQKRPKYRTNIFKRFFLFIAHFSEHMGRWFPDISCGPPDPKPQPRPWAKDASGPDESRTLAGRMREFKQDFREVLVEIWRAFIPYPSRSSLYERIIELEKANAVGHEHNKRLQEALECAKFDVAACHRSIRSQAVQIDEFRGFLKGVKDMAGTATPRDIIRVINKKLLKP